MSTIRASLKRTWRGILKSTVGPIVNVPVRFLRALPAAVRPLRYLVGWVFKSREDTNFTYALTSMNEKYLAHAVAIATGSTWHDARKYISEAKEDRELSSHILAYAKTGPDRSVMDVRSDFAKRLGWYAVVRIVKPEVVVETGVDKGLGTLILAAAVLRNGKGQVIGTDINPEAGQMLSGRYCDVARVIIGDSIETLTSLKRIDVFINDSDHSADYERREYEVIERKLSDNAVVLGDNAHVEVVLMEWAERTGRQFLFWKEEPSHHWYGGAGIGFSFWNHDAEVKRVD